MQWSGYIYEEQDNKNENKEWRLGWKYYFSVILVLTSYGAAIPRPIESLKL